MTALNVSKRIDRVCPICQKPFTTLPSRTRTNRGIFCSKGCSDRSQTVPLTERFWRFVNRTDSCWLWTGSHGNYGFISVNYRPGEPTQLLAHRVSWEIHFGEIPDGLFVLHDCPGGDQPLCVNPAHLWLGTPGDNMRDMVAKGRRYDNSGENNGSAKLTWEVVRALRALHAQGGTSIATLAASLRVHRATVQDVVHGNTWKE